MMIAAIPSSATRPSLPQTLKSRWLNSAVDENGRGLGRKGFRSRTLHSFQNAQAHPGLGGVTPSLESDAGRQWSLGPRHGLLSLVCF